MPLSLQQIIGTITGKVAFERTQANFQAVQVAVNTNETNIAGKLGAAHNTDVAAHNDIRELINDLDALKNKIINGNFIINQRVASTKAQSVGVYGYDRWKGHANGLEQVIEALPAGTYTLSWQGGGTGTFGGITALSPITATIIAGNTSVVVPSSATKVQLEEGEIVTSFKERPFGLELLLCQRYFEKTYSYDTALGTITDAGCVFEGASRNTAVVAIGIRFKVSKRVPPTMHIYSYSTGAIDKIYNGSDKNITSIAGIGTEGFRYVGIESGDANEDTNYHFIADAEL